MHVWIQTKQTSQTTLQPNNPHSATTPQPPHHHTLISKKRWVSFFPRAKLKACGICWMSGAARLFRPCEFPLMDTTTKAAPLIYVLSLSVLWLYHCNLFSVVVFICTSPESAHLWINPGRFVKKSKTFQLMFLHDLFYMSFVVFIVDLFSLFYIFHISFSASPLAYIRQKSAPDG